MCVYIVKTEREKEKKTMENLLKTKQIRLKLMADICNQSN